MNMNVHRFKCSALKGHPRIFDEYFNVRQQPHFILAQLLCDVIVLQKWKRFREKADFDDCVQQCNFSIFMNNTHANLSYLVVNSAQKTSLRLSEIHDVPKVTKLSCSVKCQYFFGKGVSNSTHLRHQTVIVEFMAAREDVEASCHQREIAARTFVSRFHKSVSVRAMIDHHDQIRPLGNFYVEKFAKVSYINK